MTDIFGFDEREIAEGAVASLRMATSDILAPKCREALMKCPIMRDIIEQEAEELLERVRKFNQACRNAEHYLIRLEGV